MKDGSAKFLVFILILSVSCAQKQQHDITAPEWPNYNLSGHVLDPDNLSALSNVRVELEQIHLLYACDSANTAAVTDSTGFFKFSAVCPGFYRFRCIRDSVVTLVARFQLLHNDTTVTLHTPKPLWAVRQKRTENPAGLVWKDQHTLAYLAGTAPVRLFEGNIWRGFAELGAAELVKDNPPVNGLARMSGGYITFYGGLQDPSLARIDSSTGIVRYLQPAPHRLRDLAFDGRFLWATSSKPAIVKLDPDGNSQIREYSAPLSHPRGVAAGATELWTSDDGMEGCSRLFRHGPDLRVTATRCPVYRDEAEQIVHIFIKYLALTLNGTLWGIADDGQARKAIYKFIID